MKGGYTSVSRLILSYPQFFRMLSGYPLDAIVQQNHVPIDDQPQRQA
jgi:hypothetical protein